MQINEAFELVKRSSLLSWYRVDYHDREFFVFGDDVSLRLEMLSGAGGVHTWFFTEDWLETIFQGGAQVRYVDLWYDQTLLKRYRLIAANGGAALLPIPYQSTMTVSPEDYKIAQIAERCDSLDEYMSRVGLDVDRT